MYKDGLARFATCPYQKPHESNLDNLYMHLTNYAIGKNEFESSKRSFLSIMQLIEKEFGIPAAENLQNGI